MEGVKITFLYQYEEKVRETLLRYKEGRDKYLARCILWDYRYYLRLLSKRWKFVCVPSRNESRGKRGFDHLPLLLDCLGIESIDVLKNLAENDQTQSKDRTSILKNIIVTSTEEIENCNVILLDDISTSGNTITACIRELKPLTKKLRVIVIASANIKH